MKTFILLIGFYLSASFPALAAASDTVYVDLTTNSYIVMDNDIQIVDIGIQDAYAAKIEKNVVFLKALKADAPHTTLFVSSGDKIFAGTIMFKQNNNQFLYDLRDKTLNKAASYSRDHYVPEVDISLIRERLFSLKNSPREIKDIGVTKNKVDWSLTNLKTDNSAIYLKLHLENQSALVYRIESVSIENAEYYKKRFLAKKKVNLLPIDPLVEGNMTDVKPYAGHDFYLAIPVYAVGKEGNVFVTIRETTGVRSMQLSIPPELMNNADLF